MKEFGLALGEQVSAACWTPTIRNFGSFETWRRDVVLSNPEMMVHSFPLQRGYSRWPISALLPIGRPVCRILAERDRDVANSALICTTPYYAPVAEAWQGPVIYYQTDLTVKYHGVDPAQVRALDRRLCAVAVAVCPNSRRVASYMKDEAGCDPAKITIVPNATRSTNVMDACPDRPADPPPDIAGLPRPLAGVIGNLAANMDWIFLRNLIRQTGYMTWVFVGPVEMQVYDPAQRKARAELLAMRGNVRFIGSKPYGALRDYARCLDVAVLPYLGTEPTYSGSSTRFYEHLAACRPIVSTRGFEELLHKEPLVHLVDSSEQAAALLNDLRRNGFRDGFEKVRWLESQTATWKNRAAAVIGSIQSNRLRFKVETASRLERETL